MNQAEKFTTVLNHISMEETGEASPVRNRDAFAVALSLAAETATSMEWLGTSVILTLEDGSNMWVNDPQQRHGCANAYPCIPAWVVLNE